MLLMLLMQGILQKVKQAVFLLKKLKNQFRMKSICDIIRRSSVQVSSLWQKKDWTYGQSLVLQCIIHYFNNFSDNPYCC